MKKKLAKASELVLVHWFWLAILAFFAMKLKFRFSVWNFLWILLALAVASAIISIGDKYAPCRRIIWPFYKASIIRKVRDKGGPLVTYPAILWIELSGRESYLKGGYSRLVNDLSTEIDSMANRVTDALGIGPSAERFKALSLEERTKEVRQAIFDYHRTRMDESPDHHCMFKLDGKWQRLHGSPGVLKQCPGEDHRPLTKEEQDVVVEFDTERLLEAELSRDPNLDNGLQTIQGYKRGFWVG